MFVNQIPLVKRKEKEKDRKKNEKSGSSILMKMYACVRAFRILSHTQCERLHHCHVIIDV